MGGCRNYVENSRKYSDCHGVCPLWLENPAGTSGACASASGRTPPKEAFLQIASQNKEPFSSFLEEAAQGLEENEESVGCFWNGLVEQERDKFLFDEEECGVLKRAGENFGYLDGQMQLKNLELYIEQTEVLIGKAQEELKDKKRLSAVLSVMCGLFLIILLV